VHVDLAVAEHEAAHMVVGLALGLRFKRAAVEDFEWRGWQAGGFTWFAGGPRTRLASGVMSCAGIAWESRQGGVPEYADGDRKLAREWLASMHDVRAATRIANEILTSRKRIHRTLAHRLCEAPLGPRDVARLVRGDD